MRIKREARLTTWQELWASRPELRASEGIKPSKGIEVWGRKIPETYSGVLRLGNAVIGPVGVLFEDMLLVDAVHYVPPGWESHDWLPFRELSSGNWFIECETEQELNGPHLFVDSFGHKNFGHLVHDSLPYAPIQIRLASEGIHASALHRPWAFASQESLAGYFFIAQTAMRTNWILAKDLLLAPRQFRLDWTEESRQDSVPISALGEIADGYSDVTTSRSLAPMGDPVYIWRPWGHFGEFSNPAGRDYDNGADLDEWLRRAGFRFLDPSRESVWTILEAVAAAPLVLGLHGAGLAHSLWANKGALIVELMGPNGAWRSIEAIAACSGVRTHSVYAQERRNRPQVDIEELSQVVQSGLNRDRD